MTMELSEACWRAMLAPTRVPTVAMMAPIRVPTAIRVPTVVRDTLATIMTEQPDHVGALGSFRADDGNRCIQGEMLHRLGLLDEGDYDGEAGRALIKLEDAGLVTPLQAHETYKLLLHLQQLNDAGATWGSMVDYVLAA